MLGLAVGAAAAGIDPAGSIRRGQEALGQGQSADAAELFEAATQEQPDAFAAWIGLGTARYRLGELTRALEAADRAMALAPDVASMKAAHNLRGLVLFEKSRTDRRTLEPAADAFTKVVELSTGTVTVADYSLALVLGELDRKAEGLQVARRIVATPPDSQTESRARALVCEYKRVLPPEPREDELSPREAADEDIRQIQGDDITPPEKLLAYAPHYTEIARKARIQGVAIVQGIIDTEGCIGNVKVLKGLPFGLDAAAAAAVSRYVFRPAMLAGEPVAVYYNITVNFRLNGKPKRPRD